MILHSNYNDLLVQKAGQAFGMALQPLPRVLSNAPPVSQLTDADRVAGGDTMRDKTSTAALASFRPDVLPAQRRALRPDRVSDAAARINASLRSNSYPQLPKEVTMNTYSWQLTNRNSHTALSVIFRVACSLLLWTFGASASDLRITPPQPKEQRTIIAFPEDRAAVEELQRWVNAGHDTWCRDARLVAASVLRGLSPQFSGYELAALPLEQEHAENTIVVYAFHGLDGRTIYRITLRRHLYLLRSAGTLHRIVWTPESAEIVTHAMQD